MTSCDMCGAEGYLVRALIEGTELNVCKNCAAYGKVLGRAKTVAKSAPAKTPTAPAEPQMIEIVVDEYPEILKAAREKLGIKQEELAKKISEKESVVHHMENGEFKPPIPLAKKLERFLHVKLVEQYKDAEDYKSGAKIDTVTLGDFIKIRKR
jgi:putative transcription factor